MRRRAHCASGASMIMRLWPQKINYTRHPLFENAFFVPAPRLVPRAGVVTTGDPLRFDTLLWSLPLPHLNTAPFFLSELFAFAKILLSRNASRTEILIGNWTLSGDEIHTTPPPFSCLRCAARPGKGETLINCPPIPHR